ncbi:hypothetical protein [Saccharopolyspora taberi]|uniref:Uncharacterized protein n=1 Tax=Saccharopolyspora taberi TaxID=60895 RepID=A0ABN3V030_9PSEU
MTNPYLPPSHSDRDVHWHAYIERCCGAPGVHSTRDERLAQQPEETFRTPEGAAEWVGAMVAAYARKDEVRLIGPMGGVGQVGDPDHVMHERRESLVILLRGDSHYVDFRGETGRVHLWVEAVTPDECKEDIVHDGDDQ